MTWGRRAMFITSVIFGCFALTVSCSVSDQENLPAASKPFITIADSSELCYAEGMTISPDAETVLLETISRTAIQPQSIVGGRLAIATVDCLDHNAAGCEIKTIRSVSGIANGQYRSSGNEIVFIANTSDGRPGYVFEAKLDGFRVTEEYGRLNRSNILAIRFGNSDRSTGQIAADINSVAHDVGNLSSGDSRAYWAGDDYIGALSTSPENLDLSQIDPDGNVQSLGVKQPYLSNPLVARTEAGASIFALGYRWQRADDSARVEPFSHPVLASNNGVVVGAFTPRTVILDRALASQGRALETALYADPGARLISVSAHPARGIVVALARAFNGDALTYIVRGGHAPVLHNRIDCGGGRANHSPTVREAVWGVGENAIPITIYETPGSKHAVVFLHGGPGLDPSVIDQSPTISFYIANGFSVVVPAYGTSVGAGVAISSKLATLGMDGQSQDARTISAGITALKRSYQVVGVHAESFGASMLTNPSLTGADFTVAVAPYLRHRDAGNWTINRLSRKRLDYQRKFETAFFGDGDFVSALSQNLSRWTPVNPHLILIAGRDDYAPASDTAFLDARDNVERIILPAANHATIFSQDVLEPVLKRYLESLSSLETAGER